MEAFYEAAADRLLIIIHQQNMCLSAESLCHEFSKRVGVTLEDFVGVEGHEFVRTSPAYRYSNPNSFPSREDGKYCEMLLIKACQLIEDNVLNFACDDNIENTAFHYLAAIPETSHLVRLLLKAKGKELALKTNINGQNILHVLAGRLRAKKDSDGDLVFENDRIGEIEWAVKDRIAFLEMLKEELSVVELSHLVNAQDEFGDTAMHEWALSTSETRYAESQIEIGQLLLDFGAKLRLPNNGGQLPLHYAFNADVFEFLVEKCDVCHVRNDLDETPLMFIVKAIITQAFSKINVTKYRELITVAKFLERVNPKPVKVRELTPFIELLQRCTELWYAIEIPDIGGEYIFDVVLSSIKISSYEWFDPILSVEQILFWKFTYGLVSLLESIIDTPFCTKHLKKEVLHTLLNFHPNIPELNRDNSALSALIKCLDMLCQKGVDINSLDTNGLTPLDIAYKCYSIRPIFSKIIIEKLLMYGARRSGNSFKRQLTSSCPKRHLQSAQDLAATTGTVDNVTVVGKFRYFNDQPIGSGAFSSVFLAIKDENLDEGGKMYCRCFALKRIEKAKVNRNEINREVKTLILLSNESTNVVKYYGVEDSDDANFQYLCLELMNGDLEQFITNNSTVLEEKGNESIMSAVRDIIRGVEFLHRKNFIHRDIKPGNILYTVEPSLQFKIADFGLTKKLFTSSTMTLGSGIAMAPGTRCWMAPELISMVTTDHNEQTDLFSLGLVLYYLLTAGKHPFATERMEPSHVIEKRIVDMQIRSDQVLQQEASSFLHQLLNKNPSKRTPAEFLHQHPFLWSTRKKIEFLKAVGSQPEAVFPTGSTLEQRLQTTTTGRQVSVTTWNIECRELFNRMTMNRKKRKIKRYKTNKVIDFLRFIRNAYSHQDERRLPTQLKLESNVFLREYPSLVLDVFTIVQQLGYEKRSSIYQALMMEQKGSPN
ncbi:uncharacterized protein LOC114522665 [Dendronephthya gigantea]|uniref:uncharacterized protein LOC114522665 n=1 Tax=Dendronephthya gigantea TaxID=151771 RepID=UPI0010696E07|nr:uncharacterized protein LOC114522665 [Dendronephthya gigantea]